MTNLLTAGLYVLPSFLFNPKGVRKMIQLLIRRFAGIFILLSLVLGYFVTPYFFLITAFVGLNLLQSSFTNYCPLQKILEKKYK